MRHLNAVLPIMCLVAIATPATAQTDGARATLVRAAFSTSGKAQAVTLVNRAIADLDGVLVKSPADRDATLQRAIGIGYRGQLRRSPGDARQARDALTAFAKRYPNDPEAQIAVAGWHLTVLNDVGGFIGGSVLGANRKTGEASLDRAVRLGGDRAFISGYAGLMRLRSDKNSTAALALLDRAAAGKTPTELDRIFKAAAQRVAVKLRAGDRSGAIALAKQALPFGKVA